MSYVRVLRRSKGLGNDVFHSRCLVVATVVDLEQSLRQSPGHGLDDLVLD